jgi:hypothetical protein
VRRAAQPPAHPSDERIGQALEQENRSVKQGSADSDDDGRGSGSDDNAGEHVGQVVRTDDHSAGRDQGSHDQEEPPDATVDEIDAESDSECGARVIARE